jgi:hypothetical protein
VAVRTVQHEDVTHSKNSRPITIGIDPGETTGVAILHPTGLWILSQLDSLPALWDLLLQTQPKLVICERFIRQPRVANLTALEYIGVTKLYVQQRYDVNMVEQTPSAAKNFVGDLMLRRNDMFNCSKGISHARDAVRHVIYYLVHGLKEISWVESMK